MNKFVPLGLAAALSACSPQVTVEEGIKDPAGVSVWGLPPSKIVEYNRMGFNQRTLDTLNEQNMLYDAQDRSLKGEPVRMEHLLSSAQVDKFSSSNMLELREYLEKNCGIFIEFNGELQVKCNTKK